MARSMMPSPEVNPRVMAVMVGENVEVPGRQRIGKVQRVIRQVKRVTIIACVAVCGNTLN
jgi:hypothetical protein